MKISEKYSEIINRLKNAINSLNNKTTISIVSEKTDISLLKKELWRRQKQVQSLDKDANLLNIITFGNEDINIASSLVHKTELTESEQEIFKSIVEFWSSNILPLIFNKFELEMHDGKFSLNVEAISEIVSKAVVLNTLFTTKCFEKPKGLKEFAKYYYDLGLNVTCISKEKTEYNSKEKNIDKSPAYEWKCYQTQRQESTIFQNYNWDKATGIGIPLGFNKIRAIDVDGCSNLGFVEHILESLDLPPDYSWQMLSGSNKGFHILIRNESSFVNIFNKLWAMKITETEEETFAFGPNDMFSTIFSRIEFRWENHLVLPPSIHSSSNQYKFIENKIPTSLPSFVSDDKILNLLLNICNKAVGKIETSHGSEIRVDLTTL